MGSYFKSPATPTHYPLASLINLLILETCRTVKLKYFLSFLVKYIWEKQQIADFSFGNAVCVGYWMCWWIYASVLMREYSLHPSAIRTCVCVWMYSYRCCLCNSSKHQGSSSLCWINKSLTSIAMCCLWNTHRQPRLSTLKAHFLPCAHHALPCIKLYSS